MPLPIPVEVRVYTLSGESVCSTNVIPLADGPSLFFAQRIDGNLNECNSGTILPGMVHPISGDTESDLFQYHIGYSDSSELYIPISIADIDDK